MDFARGGELNVGLEGFEGAGERLGVRAYDGLDDTDWMQGHGKASAMHALVQTRHGTLSALHAGIKNESTHLGVTKRAVVALARIALPPGRWGSSRPT